MSQKVMILVAKKHDTWVDIVSTFGVTRRVAEDITQEMYIKIQLQIEKGLDIMYNDEINYYYIFKTLKTLFLDLKRRQKNIVMLDIDLCAASDVYKINLISEDVDFEKSYNLVEEALEKMYWYDRKVFEIINGGESIAELSRKSKIEYFALYFTHKKVKDQLKKLI
tara:strand:- start:229 stop:726 length:498 start_codon:yes stop_codon:yes gene_type:complete